MGTGVVKLGSEIGEEELQGFIEPLLRTAVFGEEYDPLTIEEMVETAIVTALSTGTLEMGNIVKAGSGLTNTTHSDRITGARIIDEDSTPAKKHAKLYYGLVRSMKTDAARIAKHTGYSQEEIQRIKNHLFINAHDLGEEGIKRFDTDFAIAQSWQRLIAGNPEPHDLTLLRHELMESELMEQGMTQDEAHILASEKYNYSKESREYYGAFKKHKDN